MRIQLLASWMFIMCMAVPCFGKPSMEPGMEAVIKTKEVKATLYVSSLAFKDSILTGVELLWIPPSVEPMCLGRSREECVRMDHERRVIKNADGIAIGLKPSKEIPQRVLSTWSTDADKHDGDHVLKAVQSLGSFSKVIGTLKQGHMEVPISSLSKDMALRARIRWELWTNGENFRILNVEAVHESVP